MVRTKSQPKRKSHTTTIVGAAAISASDHLPTASQVFQSEGAVFSFGSSTKKAISWTLPPYPHQTNAYKSEHDTTKRTKRKLITPDKSKAKDDDDDEEELVFEQCDVLPRRIFNDDEDEDTQRSNVFGKRRRILGDDDGEDDNNVDDTTEDSSAKDATIIDGDNILQLSSSSYNIIQTTPSTSNAYEMICFHLSNTNISLGGDHIKDISTNIHIVSSEVVESILNKCNQSLDNNDLLDIDHILRAFEDRMLDVILETTTEGKVDVSIRLVIDSCIDKLSSSSRAPPIPIPRKQSIWSNRFTNYHSSYILVQALGGIFKQSIFDNVAETLLNKQFRLEQKDSLINAKMVYSVVDNAHSDEFETGEISLDIPGLVPTLRPYQVAAVRWMLRREGTSNDSADDETNNEWELCWYVIIESPNIIVSSNEEPFTRGNVLPLTEWKNVKSAPDERRLFCNPFSGWIAMTYEEAKHMMLGDEGSKPVCGGILAESMGLGKTVEVLACILANPNPLASSKAPKPPVQVENTSQNATTLHNATCICGRSNSFKDCLSWVICQDCGEEMHGRCAGFESEEDHKCMSVCCPSCTASQPIIESRATLIVTPPAILSQWQKEINRHTKDPQTGLPLKVVVYPGIRELCKSGSLSPHENIRLVHPGILADADIVLVTFQTLMTDLGHTDINPFTGSKGGSSLRTKKRYGVLPSPLTNIKWWRVCLDEAQRVETPTAASARMAQKLITERRWCVSGTPIGRGKLQDLHGLLLFLSFKPFDDKSWFVNSLLPTQGNVLKRLQILLQNIMWRSTKANDSVRRQMGIPEQEEKKTKLQFSKVEQYFYQQQYDETARAVNSWTHANGLDRLSNALQRLRAACCHPQVGTSGIGGRVRKQGSNTVLSMNQILEKLVDESREKCSEAQRISILHTIGLASLTKLKAETENMNMQLLTKSRNIYQEALDLADENASPVELIGSAVLRGCVGFRSNEKRMDNAGTVTLDWQINPSEEDSNGKFSSKLWSCITFVGLSPMINCIRVQARQTLPTELEEENATIIQPKECTLQMSSVAAGGGFVDVHSFILPNNADWNVISGFRAKKSKAWRLVIKSYHNDTSIDIEPLQRRYTGLNVQLFEPEIADDTLQRLHTLHNISNVLSTILTHTNDGKQDNGIKSKLKSMESEEQILHNNYMAHAHAIHCQRKHQLSAAVKAREKCDKQLQDVTEESDQPWYSDFIASTSIYGKQQHQERLIETVGNDLLNYYENMSAGSGVSELDNVLVRRGKFQNFNTVDGLNVALAMRIQQGEDEVGSFSQKWLKNVQRLSSRPTDGEVVSNSQCQRCREDWEQTGPVCSHCHLEEDLVKVEKLRNDPELSCVLKALVKCIKNSLSKEVGGQNKAYLERIHQRSITWFDVQSKLREEITAAKLLWRAHFDLLSDIDELNQCKRSMRLRLEGEDVSLMNMNESAFIIDPSSIDIEIMEHGAKQASALGELRRNKSSLRYLKNQRAETTASNTHDEDKSSSTNTCSVCLAGFDKHSLSVLKCGHIFHEACIDCLFNRNGRTTSTIRCPMRCPGIVRREDIFLAREQHKDVREDEKKVCLKGDFGTKVNRLVADVLDAVQLGEKGIIFSQWEEMLNIVAEALNVNQILFIRPRTGRRFGEDVKRFRSSNYPILLMNVRNGAEGLTVTEANHVYMLEPMLNCGLDSQAINRIHRIGQLKNTFVHRYIVSNTIEEKIDAIRIERQANHFEDDLQEQQKHSIKGGGIDGGFDLSELRQLFG